MQIDTIFELITTGILQIIGVVFGGFVTYRTTKYLNERNDKKLINNNRRDQLYIPLCTLIEEVRKISYVSKAYSHIVIHDLLGEQWYNLSAYAKRYLNAKNRIFLTEDVKDAIDKLNYQIDMITTNLDGYAIECVFTLRDNLLIKVKKDETIFLYSIFAIHMDMWISTMKKSILYKHICIPEILDILLTYFRDEGNLTYATIHMNIAKITAEDFMKSLHESLHDEIVSIDAYPNSSINKSIRSSHAEIESEMKEVVLYLDSIYAKLIQEIDRISAL